MSKQPVIFLAFANDHQSYLYKLTEEQNALRQALKPMEKEGLCEVVYETDTDLDKIWATFNEYQDRIAVFHYGGHAEDYSLLLQKADGQRQMADGAGLVSFLARQKGLQLVFINGCCSKRQAEELRDKGIPAVIGTSEPINDQAATVLSQAFYQGLAAGRSIEQAWLGATDKLRTDKAKQQKGYQRGIKIGQQYTQEFPWELYIRPGAEQVKEWNVPAAAHNPLFGLSLPQEAYLRLPDGPFVGLHYFRKDDAPIFFGRGAQIRELYNHLEGIHPIILLYGQSGVGKSSMLDAGLLPRIEDRYQTIYARRIQEEGLLGTLDLALQEATKQLSAAAGKMPDEGLQPPAGHVSVIPKESRSGESTPLSGVLKKWQSVEERSGKPLLLILDQAEEKFTRPMPETAPKQEDELLALLRAIQPLFHSKNNGIRGKLILSYRKEYHPEIRDAFRSLSLPYAELYLKRLDRVGIIEATEGVNRDAHTRARYRLDIEDKLPAIIADDLMEDPESPIAPVLQIILSKLWNNAGGPAAMEEQGKKVAFNIADYQALKTLGITMGEFFQQQMDKLEEMEAQGDAVHSGLALDLLKAHTTDLGTAASCSRQALLEHYDLEDSRINGLLLALADLSLLNRIDAQTTILAHDTLAPVVIRAYNLSDAPGQRAARILNNKISAVGFQLKPPYLADLERAKVPGADAPVLKQEHKGREKYLVTLQEHLEPERLQRDQAEILEKHTLFNFGSGNNRIYLDETDLSIVEQGSGEKAGSTAGMRRLSAEEKELVGISRQRRAEQRRQRRWLRLAGLVAVGMIMALGNFSFVKMKEAESSAEETNAARDLAKEQKFEARIAALVAQASQLYAGDNTMALNLALAAYDTLPNQKTRTALHDIISNKESAFYKQIFHGHTDKVTSVAFSPDGQSVLTGSYDQTAKLWTVDGDLKHTFTGHQGAVMSVAFSPDGQSILTGSVDKTARLWSVDGQVMQTFEGHTDLVLSVAFSPDGTKILTSSSDATARLWSATTAQLLDSFEHGEYIFSVVFSPSGDSILTGCNDRIARLWSVQDGREPLKTFAGHSAQVTSVAFSPDGKSILTGGSGDKTAKLWSVDSTELRTFTGHSMKVTSVAFSPDGQFILTGSEDKTARLWSAKDGQLLKTFKGHSGPVTSVAFSPDGNSILTGSIDTTARLWPVVGGPLLATFQGHTSDVNSVVFSPDGQFILTGSTDATANLWSLDGKVLQTFKGDMRSPWSIFALAFSPDGRDILTGSDDSIARLWSMDGNVLKRFKGHGGGVTAVAFSPGGDSILTGSKDNTARFWSLDGKALKPFEGHKGGVKAVAFSLGGNSILTGSWDETARLWSLDGTGLRTFTGHSGWVNSVAFSPGGDSILTGSQDHTTRLWSLDGTVLRTFTGHSGPVTSVAFSPDGKKVLTGSEDMTARLWSVDGQVMQTFEGHTAPVLSVAFSPDGQFILTGSGDRTARLWRNYHWEVQRGKIWDNIYKLNKAEQKRYGIDWEY